MRELFGKLLYYDDIVIGWILGFKLFDVEMKTRLVWEEAGLYFLKVGVMYRGDFFDFILFIFNWFYVFFVFFEYVCEI